MLVIPTYIEKSEIDGLGLFAAKDIESGSITWYLDPSIDLVIPKDVFANILNVIEDAEQKERLVKWSYTRNEDIIFCVDNAKFINHSNTPNIKCEGQYDIATRDIVKGEEITADYQQFEDEPNEVEKSAFEKTKNDLTDGSEW